MISIHVSINEDSLRIDTFLALHYPEYTRTFLKKLILSGTISRNGSIITKSSSEVHEGDIITITSFELPKRTVDTENIPDLYVDFCKKYGVFEHEHFLIIEKPAGLITHHAEGNSSLISLSDIIIKERPEIASVGQEGRHGIVHRLDKETSGLLIIARTNYGYETCIELFKQRKIQKTYYAIVHGHPEKSGIIDEPIMRHPADPRKMICGLCEGRPAQTKYEVMHYYSDKTHQSARASEKPGANDYALIKAYPLTGRTHQIRVHMASIGHPVFGDSLYGTSSKRIKRHALHAYQLSFKFDEKQFEFTSSLPEDIQNLLN